MISKPVEIGKFGRIHALDGNIRVFSYTSPEENIFTYHPWFIFRNKTYESISISMNRPIKKGFIVSIDGVSTPELAQVYVDKMIYIDRTMLPELKEGHYWHDLIDKQVVNLSNSNLGTVIALHDSGAHDLLLIKKNNGKLLYIPYIDQYVIRVEKNNIIVDWEYEN